jgi:hypothetical protein
MPLANSWLTGNPGHFPNQLQSSPYRIPFLGNMTVNAVGPGPADGSFGDGEASNSAFFLNTVEYLTASSSSATSTPEPSIFVFTAVAGVTVILRRRKRGDRATKQ